jgi:hypothetical protein
LWKLDNKLGAVRWEYMLRQQHGSTIGVGGSSRTAKNRRPHRNTQQQGILRRSRIGPDGLRRTFQRDIKEFVKRRPFNVGSRQMLT